MKKYHFRGVIKLFKFNQFKSEALGFLNWMYWVFRLAIHPARAWEGSSESLVTEAQFGQNRIKGQTILTFTCFIISITGALHLPLHPYLRLLGEKKKKKPCWIISNHTVSHKPEALSTWTNPTEMLPKLERICVYVHDSQMASCKAHSKQKELSLTDTKPSLSNNLMGPEQLPTSSLPYWSCDCKPSLNIKWVNCVHWGCLNMWISRRDWRWSVREQKLAEEWISLPSEVTWEKI